MKVLEYQNPCSEQTLREGMAEYFSTFDEFLSTRNSSTTANEFFRCHDAAHVVFGCGLSLEHEVVVKVSTVFGSTGGMKILKGYALPESHEIYEEITILDGAKVAAKTLIIVPKILWRCFRMSRRWPWDEFDAYLDLRLIDLREEFGIRVGH
ncbi:MAG: hypothetical protein AB8B96_05795 [Lysobacterales bacterium]